MINNKNSNYKHFRKISILLFSLKCRNGIKTKRL